LRRVPSPFRVSVYDKGGQAGSVTGLPNLGREAHTYLHHIVLNYEKPMDLTVFSQGKPFDHVPDFHTILRQLSSGSLRVVGFRWLGFIIDRDDRSGSLLFKHWRGNADGRALNMEGFCRAIGRKPIPENFIFYPGAHFVVTSQAIRRRPLSFYRKALEISAAFPDAAHCFERCWDWIFGADGIPPAFRNANMPVYLRPVQRLGLTWTDVARNRRMAEEDTA